MSDEILNIDYHVRRMVIKALNKTKYVFEAAEMLGVSSRSVYRYMEIFGIGYNRKKKEYEFIQPVKIKSF